MCQNHVILTPNLPLPAVQEAPMTAAVGCRVVFQAVGDVVYVVQVSLSLMGPATSVSMHFGMLSIKCSSSAVCLFTKLRKPVAT